ncbi:hypothetical protein PG999_004922 [Apiospora kogelbergensis]|uniref:Uncharacterized protein n=1 Tax=Apiospora kogelbergensis TaxID=1337665 RepID=A0AAW0R0N1_9PEZI
MKSSFTISPTLFLVLSSAASAAENRGFRFSTFDYGGGDGEWVDANSLQVRVSPDSVVLDFFEPPDAKPNSYQANFTINMLGGQIKQLTPGWKFAFDSGDFVGHAKFPAGTRITEWASYASLVHSFVINPHESNTNWNWSVKKSPGATLNADEVDFVKPDADFDGDFSVSAKSQETNWSPCYGNWTDPYQTQFSVQTQIHWELPAGKDSFDVSFGGVAGEPALTQKIKLKWEQCDPQAEPFSGWGEQIRIDTPRVGCLTS